MAGLLSKNKELQFMDLGANLGVFSLGGRLSQIRSSAFHFVKSCLNTWTPVLKVYFE
jgi:hypothetical protein